MREDQTGCGAKATRKRVTLEMDPRRAQTQGPVAKHGGIFLLNPSAFARGVAVLRPVHFARATAPLSLRRFPAEQS